MKAVDRESRLVALLQRLNGWRLWLLVSLAAVLAAGLIVSLMGLALLGRVTSDYLITGLVTAGIVAPSTLLLMSVLLREIARSQQQRLTLGIESAEARLRLALDSTDEGILMVSSQGKVLSANQRFFELWRVPPEVAAPGQDKLLLAHVLDQLVDPEGFLRGVQQLYAGDNQSNDTLHFKDGRVFERYTRGLSIGEEDGRIWCFRDVSVHAQTRQALAEREEQYRAIVNQAGEGIHLVDAETLRFLEVNEAACRMLGFQRDELVGQPLGLILVPQQGGAATAADLSLDPGSPSHQECRHRRKDGGVIDVLVNTRAIRLRGRTCLVGVWHDIGERKAAQEALERSRNLLQAIIDAVPMRIFWKDQQLRYLGCNPAFARDAGRTDPQELLGKDDYQMAWAEQADSYRADDRAVMASGVPRLSFEEQQTTASGQTVWLRTSKVPLRDSAGRTIGILGIYEDFTARRQAEAALREREEIFSAIVNRSVEGILLIDAQTMEFTEFNDAACQGLGYTREEFMRLRLPDVQGNMSPAETYAKCQVAARTPEGLSFENRHKCKDGSLRDRHVSNRPVEVGGRIYLAHVWHDVTDSNRIAAVLREREQYQRAVLDNFPFMVWLKDAESRFLAVNAQFARVFGRPSKESLIGQTDLDIAPPELAQRYRADDRAVLESGQSKQVEELVETEGRHAWFETYKSPVSIDGKVIGTVGFSRDITSRKEAEWNLQMAVEVTQVVFWKIDLLTRELSFDKSRLQTLGLDRDDEFRSLTNWMERVHPEDIADFMQRFEAALGPGSPVFDMEYRLRRNDGEHVWIHTKGRAIQHSTHGRPELAVGTSMDITARKRIEQAARASEERSRNLATLLRLMTDNVPDMIWAKDLEKRYLFANRALCQQLLNATDTDEPLGKTDMFFALRERQAHAEDPNWHTFGELCQDSDTVTLERGEPSVFEEFGNIKGRMTYLDVRKAPFVDQAGAVIGTVGSARDVTQRIQADAELEQHRQHLEELVQQRTTELLATEARASQILDSAADGLYGVDVQGRITFINAAACRMLGYAAKDVVGALAHDLFHHSRSDGTPLHQADCLQYQALVSGQVSRIDEETYWHADGHPVPVALATHPIVQNGQVVGAVVSVVDVSLQRAAALARERALVAAEDLARARSEFLANMSHEIRTPMNGVLGFAHIGLQNCHNPERARSAFQRILSSGNQLLGVVNEILDFSKIDAGKMQVERTELSITGALDSAIQLVAERAAAKGLSLRLTKSASLPPACMGDPLRLGQILLNLLTNAIKFTESGSVELFAGLEGDELVFRVTDTGIGMSADQLGYIFNPFQQADGSITRKFGGTGLGLAICKRLLELMHGRIRVQSAPGEGSRFEVRLPYEAPAREPGAEAAAPRPVPAQALAGVAILVVEDDKTNQQMLRMCLEDSGARVVIADDGALAVERIEVDGPKAYDLVLMDIQMPTMDGYESARRILRLAPRLPIIGQTAHAFAEDRDRCLAAGMVGHLAKPIDPSALIEVVLQKLGRR